MLDVHTHQPTEHEVGKRRVQVVVAAPPISGAAREE
jgi:hypothetical protein